MRICHLSDSHGKFPKLNGFFDVIVHSGDWLPDFVAPREFRAQAQEDWVSNHLGEIKSWINNKPFIFAQGNHDFANPNHIEQILKSAGIYAVHSENKIIECYGYKFYGFPYTPYINDNFNYGLAEKAMTKKVAEMAEVINSTYVDVVIAHCPPTQCLSSDLKNNIEYGNPDLKQMIDFKIQKDMMPSLFCVGHIHSAFGIKPYKNTLISNAATSQFILEI